MQDSVKIELTINGLLDKLTNYYIKRCVLILTSLTEIWKMQEEKYRCKNVFVGYKL